MNDPTPRFLDALGDQLAEAARHQHAPAARRRAQPVVLVAACIALVVGLVGATALLGPAADRPALAFTIEQTERGHRATLTAVADDLNSISDQFAEIGVAVTVTERAVPDWAVGLVVGIEVERLAGVASVERADDQLISVEVDEDFAGTLRIDIGRAAAEGEPFAISPPPVALCAVVGGRTLDDVRERLDGVTDTVRYLIESGTTTVERTPTPTDESLAVIDIVAGDDEILVVLSDDSERAGPRGCESL